MRSEWPDAFAETPCDRDAVLVMASLPSLHPSAIFALAMEHGSAHRCLAAVVRGQRGSAADRARVAAIEPAEIRASLRACRARVVLPGSREFPSSFGDLADPPAALFVRGRSLDSLLPGVAVIGARSCSTIGRDVAGSLGRGLARAGVTVVSGAARGIDAASQHGALTAPGATVAFLGSGIDIAYPKSSAPLLSMIAEVGAIVSEYPPGTPAEPWRFPARNRLIAAAARAVVVVEGAGRSGTLITGDIALQLGRTVFAVPGSIVNPLSEVPIKLIRDGARAIGGIEDLLEDLGASEGTAVLPIRQVSQPEQDVLNVLHDATLPDQVATVLGWELPAALSVLWQLEVRGLVANHGGRFVARKGG